MIGNMIKICSLDLLNKEIFEADVMTADRKVLFFTGEKITPSVILKLYFRDIYIEEALKEKEETKEPEVLQEIESTEKIAKKLSIVNSEKFSEENLQKTPHKIELEEIEKEEVSYDIKEPSPDLVRSELEKTDYTIINEKFDGETASVNIVNVNKEVQSSEQVENFLAFDEKQASRIADYSVKIGEILNFTKNELEELKQAAYYCNIGISKFKMEDLNKKGFDKRKALKSYEIVLNEKGMSEKISEAVKFCINNYDSNTFSLDSKIPYYHIVAITNYYEKRLSEGNSKQKTLEKMLQLGGNKFNIFVLHKFIKIMRESE